MDSLSLFRSEVLNTPADSFAGEIQVKISVASWVVVAFSTTLVLCVCLFLWFGTYTKRSATTGILLPEKGMLRIHAPMNGVVSETFVKEGQSVQKGQRLFTIADQRAVNAGQGEALVDLSTKLGAAQSAKLAELEVEQKMTEQQVRGSEKSLQERISRIQSERESLKKEANFTQARLRSAQARLEQDRQLETAKFLSKQAVSLKEEEIADLHSKLASLDRMALTLEREQAEAKNELQQIPMKLLAQKASFEQRIAGFQQEAAEQQGKSRVAVLAPSDGIVTSISADPGSPVGQQPLAILLPKGSGLEANLYVPSQSIGFVEPGQKVLLRYKAYPYQKFGQYSGKVAEVSRAQLSPDDLPAGIGKASPEGMYRVRVKLDSQSVMAYGHLQNLIPGMTLEADILQEKRRLIEWIFEPLFSIKGKL